jgi:hypothetical protein
MQTNESHRKISRESDDTKEWSTFHWKDFDCAQDELIVNRSSMMWRGTAKPATVVRRLMDEVWEDRSEEVEGGKVMFCILQTTAGTT